MADDYIQFISQLKEYLAIDLEFIPPEKSKWKNAPQVGGDKRFGSYPIGRLKDVEVFFLHARTPEEAREKWLRRIERVNWDRLLIKFNDQNGCTSEHVERFLNLPYRNKVFFTCKKWGFDHKDIITICQPFHKEHMLVSYEPVGKSKYIDITKVLNSL